MERKIGEIFEFGGEWYQCLKSASCDECAFLNSNCIDNPSLKCSVDDRTDNCTVIFKKLEKVGEEFLYKGKQMQSYIRATDELICNWNNNLLLLEHGDSDIIDIEIKQTKEDMEEKKIRLSQDDIDWLKKRIRWDALPGYIAHEEDYDRATEEIMNLFIPSDTEHSNSESIKKNLKPFDLEAAKAGKPVCTRDGRKARIICFDAKRMHQPIIALITQYNGVEYIETYYSNGCFNDDINSQSDYDLMMLSEKK